MTQDPSQETQVFWDSVAEDWQIQVGEEGDANRRLNSDPVLWKFAGKVSGLQVLDAGCGTGYLSRQLREKEAQVIGVDFSERMIDIARGKGPGIDFRVDSCSELSTVAEGSIDLILSNYVLMDVPDLEGAVGAFYRVLKPGGTAVVVFSHPCFPAGRSALSTDGKEVDYHWSFSYFDRQKCTDPPWDHFKTDFIWFHRPLADYWKSFKSAGFEVLDFEEPVAAPVSLQQSGNQARIAIRRPFSVAFKLGKP